MKLPSFFSRAKTPAPMAGSGPRGDSGYEIAQLFSRFHKEIIFANVDTEDKEMRWADRKRMLVHSYQMARAYPYAYAACVRLADHVIGDGVWPTPKTGNDEFDEMAALKFKAHWDDARLCDVRNRQGLTAMLRHLVPHVCLYAGDAGLRILPGMRYNPYESDRIGPPDKGADPVDEVMGVRVTPWGEFTGFRVGGRAASGVTNSEVVPASDFLFVARHLLHRFDQVRGVPAIAQAFGRLIYGGEITTAELRVALAASKVGWYQPVEGLDGVEVPKDANGNPIWPKFQLQDGTVLYGPPGHEPKSFKYERPGDNFATIMRMVWSESASVLGMSYEMLTGDYSKTNFSVIRGVRLEDASGFRSIQQHVVKPILDRLFYWSTSRWIKTRELPTPPKDFEGDAANYMVSWSFPKLEHIDPYKEHQANRLSLENGASLRDIYGDKWEEVIRERAKQQRRIKEIAAAEGVDPEDIFRPVSKERTQELGSGAEQIRAATETVQG